MVAMLFIALGLLLQTIHIPFYSYFLLSGIILLLPSYTIRFFMKMYKEGMDYIKLLFVWYWVANTVLVYEQLSHWILIVIQIVFFIIIGRHEMKVYAKSLTGFSKSSKHSFMLFTIAGLVAATGGLMQMLGFQWAAYCVAFGFLLGIAWLLKGWMRL